MELSGIKDYFQTITSADEINIRKPHPEIYQYAFEKSDAQKENSVMIGDDWIADIVGAKEYGVKTIFLDALNENPKDDDILIIKDLLEICNYL